MLWRAVLAGLAWPQDALLCLAGWAGSAVPGCPSALGLAGAQHLPRRPAQCCGTRWGSSRSSSGAAGRGAAGAAGAVLSTRRLREGALARPRGNAGSSKATV